jgi:hypothetical protein
MQLVFDDYTDDDFNRIEMMQPEYHNNDNIKCSLSAPHEHKLIDKLIHDILPCKDDRDNFMKMSKLVVNGNVGNYMYILYGNGSNGKSTLLLLLSSILEDDHSNYVAERRLNSPMCEINPGCVQDFNNKRLIISEIYDTKYLAPISNSVFLKNKPLIVKRLFKEPVIVRLNVIYACIVKKFDVSTIKNATIINCKTVFKDRVTNVNEKLLDPQFFSNYFTKKHSEAFLHYILHYKY